MCFLGSSPPQDNSAAVAQQREAARQAAINQGITSINHAFDGTPKGINPATTYAPGTSYFGADGSAYTPATRAQANDAYLAQQGLTPDQIAQFDAGKTPAEQGSYLAAQGYSTPQSGGSATGHDYFDASGGFNPIYKGNGPPATLTPEMSLQAYQAQRGNADAAAGKLFTGTQTVGGFDKAYYDGIGKAYTDYQQPQLDDQYAQQSRALQFALSNAGIADSSAGAYETGLLQTAYGREKANIANQAITAENNQRAAVASAKNNLLNVNATSADPASTAASTAASLETLQKPASFSPLGNVLAGVINTGAIGAAGFNQAGGNLGTMLYGPNGAPLGVGGGNAAGGSGSSYTVHS